MTALQTVAKLRANGIVYPWRTYWAARRAGLDLRIACALLEQESDGGWNVFGHDPTIFQGAGAVTQDKYRAYKRQRQASGNRLMQGVGPTQLTWWEFQDRADALGGCWRPYVNMLVGFRIFAAYLRTGTLREAAAKYNGSGPYDAYASSVIGHYVIWRSRLS